MKQKKTFRKSILLGLVLISLSAAAFTFFQPDIEPVEINTPLVDENYDVKILRDTWGVPHIFGVTDPDVSYGLGYAHSEDDFKTIQNAILGARGNLAAYLGKKYAPLDYLVQLLRVWDVVNQKFDTDVSPDIKALCAAYAAGVNHYAKLHPKVAYPGFLPVTAKDIIAGFVLKVPFFFGVHKKIKELYKEERRHTVSKKTVAKYDIDPSKWEDYYGSNGFAVSPARSAGGETFLAVNAHQPWEGPFTWYEVNLHSEQGWDITGGLFPTSPVVMVGHNKNLGWVHTVNKPDLVDTYVLEINPENENQYKFDGEWLDLEIRPAPLKVKFLNAVSWTFEREALWSVYGPVVRRPHGTYALRYPGMNEVRHLEQWYHMNKAQNFQEWESAMKIMAIPKFNCVYADYQGNIFYLYNAKIPIRAEGYDWRQYLPGNTSETLWTEFVPYEGLPKVFNPASGFVQSCNNTPFRTTTGDDNPIKANYSPTMGIENRMTNRAYRALELFGNDPFISEEEFYEYKFDETYSKNSVVVEMIQRALTIPVPKDDEIAQEAVEIVKSWDFKANAENTRTALVILTFQPFVLKKEFDTEASVLFDALVTTATELKQNFGRIDVPWQQVNRLIRGDLDVGIAGGPDALHAVYAKKMKDGRLRGFLGDCYSVMVTWDKNGKVRSKSIHQYGSATQDKSSPHYNDQAKFFAERKYKPVWLDEKDVRAHLEQEYQPGAELRN